MIVQYTASKRTDQFLGTAAGAMNQTRFLGGAIGLAISSNILNGKLQGRLADTLSSDQMHRLLETTSMIASLPEKLRHTVEEVFGESYTLQFQVMIAFAALQIPASILMFKRGRQYVAA